MQADNSIKPPAWCDSVRRTVEHHLQGLPSIVRVPLLLLVQVVQCWIIRALAVGSALVATLVLVIGLVFVPIEPPTSLPSAARAVATAVRAAVDPDVDPLRPLIPISAADIEMEAALLRCVEMAKANLNYGCTRDLVNAWAAGQIVAALGVSACTQTYLLESIAQSQDSSGAWAESSEYPGLHVVATSWATIALAICGGHEAELVKAADWLVATSSSYSDGLSGWPMISDEAVEAPRSTYATSMGVIALGRAAASVSDPQRAQIYREVSNGAADWLAGLLVSAPSSRFPFYSDGEGGTSLSTAGIALYALVQSETWARRPARYRRQAVSEFLKALPRENSVGSPWEFSAAVLHVRDQRKKPVFVDFARLYKQPWLIAGSAAAYCAAGMRGRFRSIDFIEWHSTHSEMLLLDLANHATEAPWIVAESLLTRRFARELSQCDRESRGARL